MAKKTLLTASQIQSVEPYIQNVLIEKKSGSLMQSSLVQASETLTQEISIEPDSKLLLPSKESSAEQTQDILISERAGDSLITNLPTDVEIIYVPNIQPVQYVRAPKKSISEVEVRVSKPFLPCDAPTLCATTPQYQGSATPSYSLPITTPSNITILDNTKANAKWHPDGIVFFGDPENPLSIMYTSGKIIIHEWYVLPIAQITEIGKENYHPERRWEVLGNVEGLTPAIILEDLETHYIFAKVPISEDIVSAEIIVTKEYNFEDIYEGHLYILMGIINHIDELLVLSMLWGDDAKVTKTYPPVETREVIDSTECVKVNGVNIGTKRTYFHTETKNPKTLLWVSNNNPQTRDSADYTTCPPPVIPGVYTRETRNSSNDYCEELNGFNTGIRFLYLFEETKIGDGPWIATSPIKSRFSSEYNTTLCPLLPFRVSMSTGPLGGYNFSNETSIEYSPGSPIFLSSPIYENPDDYDYFYLSIPTGKTFTVSDSIGSPIRGDFSNVGIDNRIGFRGNTVYMKADPYDTHYPGMFTLKIN